METTQAKPREALAALRVAAPIAEINNGVLQRAYSKWILPARVAMNGISTGYLSWYWFSLADQTCHPSKQHTFLGSHSPIARSPVSGIKTMILTGLFAFINMLRSPNPSDVKYSSTLMPITTVHLILEV